MPASLKGYNDLLRTVEQTITDYRMLNQGDAVLVCVSGGPDSVSLLHLLLPLVPKYCLKLGIAHLDHGLRPGASEKEARFVASLADKHNMPFFIKKLDVRNYQAQTGLSLEEAARHLRYRYFDETAREHGFNRIALGHHMEDNAETVLMSLFRGSGPLGLSGIPPKRQNRYIRPLIRTCREELLAFLRHHGIPFHLDASNRNPDRTRNRIRRHLIPHIQRSYNPRIVQTLNRLAMVMESENNWADEMVAPLFETALVEARQDAVYLSAAGLLDVHRAAARRMLRTALLRIKGDLRRITCQHLDMVMELLMRGPDRGSIDLPDRVRVRRYKDVLCLRQEKNLLRDRVSESSGTMGDAGPFFFEYRVSGMGSVWIKEAGVRLTFSRAAVHDMPDFRQAGTAVAFLDMDRLTLPLTVRNPRPGDRFTPLGMRGTQKVKKYFINHKVPRGQRSRCPLVLSQGKIVWIAGHRIDDSVKVGPHTGNVLKAELLLA